ncbi:MAG TPA: PhzF family phenazine biosynthesis protein [Jiangellaceae bacterium]
MPTHPYVLLDVFTDRPLAGNQLAVFTAADAMDEADLQPLARELNLSETVFVLPPRDGGDVRARYFSSVTELEFAGHPTLGTAGLLAVDRLGGDSGAVTVTIETGRGTIPIDVRIDDDGRIFGWMSQPLPSHTAWLQVEELCTLLRVGSPSVPVEVYDNGIAHLFLVLDSPAEVVAIQPDFAALGRLCGRPIRINVAAGSGTSYTSRMFSPFDYVPEDPACGSAAGPLALHLVRHGRIGSGEILTIAQGAQVGRPSTLFAQVTAEGDEVTEVRVGGHAVIVGRGTFTLGNDS